MNQTGATGVRNLLHVYSLALPVEVGEARSCYLRYHTLLEEIARPLGFAVRTAAAVFSALSPNNSYIANLKDARKLLTAVRNGDTIDSFKVTTYHPNKRKAWHIATHPEEDPLKSIVALKTRNFYQNLLDPMDPKPVTVDGHIYWCWRGRRGVVKTRSADRADTAPPHLSRGLYEEIADAVRLCAEIHGVIPCEAQAVIWVTYRRVHGIQGSSRQMEFLTRDVFAAGCPDHPLGAGGCGL